MSTATARKTKKTESDAEYAQRVTNETAVQLKAILKRVKRRVIKTDRKSGQS